MRVSVRVRVDTLSEHGEQAAATLSAAADDCRHTLGHACRVHLVRVRVRVRVRVGTRASPTAPSGEARPMINVQITAHYLERLSQLVTLESRLTIWRGSAAHS